MRFLYRIQPIIAAASLSLGLLCTQPARADIDTALTGHWNFDNCDASDSSDNANDGVLEGGPKCKTGIFGNAFYFDGNNDLVRIPSPFTAETAGALTVSAWVKTSSTKTLGGIVAHHTACAGNDDYFHLTLYGAKASKLSGDFFNGTQVSWGASAITNNKWHHIVMKYDGTRTYLYLDGALRKFVTGKGQSTFDGSVDLTIGGFSYNACNVSGTFEGLIDDVRIYSRVLTAADISELYNTRPVQQNVAGTTTGLQKYQVRCMNASTGDILDIPEQNTTSWDCQKAGLQISPNEKVQIIINGTASLTK